MVECVRFKQQYQTYSGVAVAIAAAVRHVHETEMKRMNATHIHTTRFACLPASFVVWPLVLDLLLLFGCRLYCHLYIPWKEKRTHKKYSVR